MNDMNFLMKDIFMVEENSVFSCSMLEIYDVFMRFMTTMFEKCGCLKSTEEPSVTPVQVMEYNGDMVKRPEPLAWPAGQFGQHKNV